MVRKANITLKLDADLLREVRTPFERLFLGGIRDAMGLSASNKLQIKTVINVSMEKTEPRSEGITYLHIPLPDGSRLLPGSWSEF